MKSKKRTIGILIVVIVLLLGFAGSLLIYRNKLSSEIIDYLLVDKELYEKIVSENFKNASLEERKEIAFNLLNKLESENKIKKGSIKFNEKYNSYFFEYLDGGEGSIILGNFLSTEENEDDRWRTYNISNISNSTYIQSNTKYIGNYVLNSSANGYIKENLSNNNLTYYPKKALIIDDVSFIDKNGNPTIYMQETLKLLDFKKYWQDRKEKRIGTTFGYFGGNCYLTSSFFSYYYSNKFTDTIIWISCCNGYINDNLVSAFANECNAKSVIGVTDSVYEPYEWLLLGTL